MEKILIDDLYLPDYYMEVKGLDVRLGMKKFDDLLKTVGEANFSLLYSDENEYDKDNENDFELSIVRRMHIRHAILDFNNSFDILLQVPWLFYRAWEEYNIGKPLHKSSKNHKDIIRNSDKWVIKAGKACSFQKVYKYLDNSANMKLKKFGDLLNDFYKTYINNQSKKFTIRSLANMIKHNSALQLRELNEPWEFNLKLKEFDVISLKEKGLEAEIKGSFYDMKSGKTEGEFLFSYSDDIYLDIKYKNGEVFKAKDYMFSENNYSIIEIRDECINFNKEIIALYNQLFNILGDDLSINIVFKPNKITKSSIVNLDKYFKP